MDCHLDRPRCFFLSVLKEQTQLWFSFNIHNRHDNLQTGHDNLPHNVKKRGGKKRGKKKKEKEELLAGLSFWNLHPSSSIICFWFFQYLNMPPSPKKEERFQSTLDVGKSKRQY